MGSDSEGNIFFVPRALPGDSVKVAVVSQDKKYFECDLVEVVSPSKERVEPPCNYFHQCGGCDWLNWNYLDQLKGKQRIIEHALERATLKPERVLPMLGAENPLFYRNRVQLRMASGKLGFFKKQSHEIVDIESCKVAQPSINEAIQKIRASGLKIDDEIEKLELYVHDNGEVKTVRNAAHSIEGFRQINEEQNLKLQRSVAEYVRGANSKSVLELFCGNGNLTFSYLDSVEKVIAIDSSQAAIDQARAKRSLIGLESQGLSVAFISDLVSSSTRRKLPAEFKEQYDTLIVDPPRSGLQGALSHLIHQQLKTIIYISCSVQSFSQDVQCLKNQFRFEEIQPIDMFPQTRHIEFVAKFSRL